MQRMSTMAYGVAALLLATACQAVPVQVTYIRRADYTFLEMVESSHTPVNPPPIATTDRYTETFLYSPRYRPPQTEPNTFYYDPDLQRYRIELYRKETHLVGPQRVKREIEWFRQSGTWQAQSQKETNADVIMKYRELYNVILEPIPEPSTLLLLGVGGAVLLAATTRRRWANRTTGSPLLPAPAAPPHRCLPAPA